VFCRLCSLAQDAKQETEDSGSLKKKSIKPEPVTSEEEEAADAKPQLGVFFELGAKTFYASHFMLV